MKDFKNTSPRKQCLVATHVLIALVLVAPFSALAHARLERSTPTDKSKLTESPKQIDLWFSELLDAAKFDTVVIYSSAELKATTHTNLALGDPTVDPKDQTHLTVMVKPLPPGDYTVDWRVLSQDGHSAPGRFSFHVLPPK
jgi:methionine-rich copper-binding protein CopC